MLAIGGFFALKASRCIKAALADHEVAIQGNNHPETPYPPSPKSLRYMQISCRPHCYLRAGHSVLVANQVLFEHCQLEKQLVVRHLCNIRKAQNQTIALRYFLSCLVTRCGWLVGCYRNATSLVKEMEK